ncbi:hypothetical protein IC769_08885 [Acinetobacter seifertii]|nr:hypothetical protein [Acinetobacter seifertii]QNY07908.1 hypothetical protein IC769_08885 [Acinetobacter seifertii]
MNIEHSKTKPSLGRGSLFFMVIAAAAPLTTMAAFAPLGFMLGGVAMPLGYIIAGITYIFFAIGFLALVRHNPRGGAFYTYISMGLGKNIGVGSALSGLREQLRLIGMKPSSITFLTQVKA